MMLVMKNRITQNHFQELTTLYELSKVLSSFTKAASAVAGPGGSLPASLVAGCLAKAGGGAGTG
jgi:hypothetical protein